MSFFIPTFEQNNKTTTFFPNYKAKYVYEAVYNSMKNCLNCLKRRHCFLWHQANNFSKANDVNYHCCMSDKWEDEDYAEE